MKNAIVRAVAELTILKYFPADEIGRRAVMHFLARLVGTEEHLAWLTRTLIDHVGEWPGPKEVRGIFCSRFRPLDGVEVDATHPLFSPAAMEMRHIEQQSARKELGAGVSTNLLPVVRKV